MSSTRRVVCTGIGSVSPLGIGARSSWQALLSAKSCIKKLRQEHLFEDCNSQVAAYVDEEALQKELRLESNSYLVKNAKQLSRATLFAMLSAREALTHANLMDNDGSLQERFRTRCGVSIGQGMVDFDDIYENGSQVYQNKKGGVRRISPYFMTRALINMSSGNVSIRYKLMGPNNCVSTACATGAHSIGDAINLIKYNKADIMLCGSTEASINKLAIAGFDRLRALSTKMNDNPETASRPFDKNRCGFVMGEGAGLLVLEELEHAKSRGITDSMIIGEALGFGSSSDANHLTAPLPDGGGALRCMKAALQDALIECNQIGHINAHATSTPLGDDIECNAIESLISEQSGEKLTKMFVTSCKGSIGHLLGAAGSVESIFALLSCSESLIPPNVNLNNPLETSKNLIEFVGSDKPRVWSEEQRFVMKNSFGFGGTNASLIFSNYPIR